MKIQDLFTSALEQPPSAREAFLRKACGNDEELYREVNSLLQADSDVHSILDGSAADVIELRGTFSLEGKRIGPYRIVQQIGTGGMGAVYLAERADGHFEQQVALKLIKRGMDSEEILKRFQSERQILAQLQHPNVARLLDGGLTAEGLPYFTMEYVKGEPIDAYCDRLSLTIDERLHLCITVCAAVQYAHGRLIVHRDLKPSNIMVTEEGRVKLLDFGISKVLGSADEGGTTGLTHAGMKIMTPEYASPEQVRGEPVTTASDVYSLGIVLYELLTGRRPYRFPTSSPVDIEKVISTTQPEKPSTVVQHPPDAGTENATSEVISKARSTLPEKLRRRLAGDLDNICMKALRKEPEHRYNSVEQLRQDLAAHLNGLPVSARPATVGYRMQKFVQRHRFGVVASMIVLVLVGGLTLFYTIRLAEERDRAQLEAQKAAQVVDFLTGIFKVSDPDESKGETITARELLDSGAVRIQRELADQPEVQAKMFSVVGRVYHDLGLYNKAEPMFRKALEIRRLLFGEENRYVATSLNDLGSVLSERGEYENAEPLLRESLSLQRKLSGSDNPEISSVLDNLSWLLSQKGNYQEAESLLREELSVLRAHKGNESPEVATTMNNLAVLLNDKGKSEEAEQLYRQALAIQRKNYGDVHPEVSTTMYNLADILRQQARYSEAESLYQACLAIDRKVFGEQHHNVAFTLTSLGRLQRAEGHLDQAEESFRSALAIRVKSLGKNHPEVAYNLSDLGTIYLSQGKYDSAMALHRRALQILLMSLGPNNKDVPIQLDHIGRVMLAEGRLDSAEAYFRRSLRMERKMFGDRHRFVAATLLSLGDALRERKKYVRADSAFKEALAIYTDQFGPDHPAVASCYQYMASLSLAIENTDQAEEFCRQGLILDRKALPPSSPQTVSAMVLMGDILLKKNEATKAEPLLRDAFRSIYANSPDDIIRGLKVRASLGNCLVALHRYEEAEPLLVERYNIVKANPGSKRQLQEAVDDLITLYRAWNKPVKVAAYQRLLKGED